MNLLVLLILFLVGTNGGPSETEHSDNDTLILLHILFHHGNTASDESTFPNDPNINETYYPFGFGQLTQKGKITGFHIGTYLRQTYNSFIPVQYTRDVSYALTTNFKRTKMSLGLVLAGLFPPQDFENLEGLCNWQPISFNIEQGQGIIGNPSIYCTSFNTQYMKYVLRDQTLTTIAGYSGLYWDLSKYTGEEIVLPRDVLSLYISLKSAEDFGLTLPEWTVKYYPEAIEEAAALDYEFATATPILKRLNGGGLLKKIIQDTNSKIQGSLSNERKIYLYSTHESNIAAMLRNLNVFYRHVPPFGATIFFEIHHINGEYGLKLLYQDYKDPTGKPTLLTIPGCERFCPLDQFTNLVKDNLPGPYDVCEPAGEVF